MSDNTDLRLCTITDLTCNASASVGDHGTINAELVTKATNSVWQSAPTPLDRAVEILNEAMHTVPGVSSHLHWPLPMTGDAENSSIECFMSQDAVTTNLLGILNAIVSFTKDGILHRIEFSKDENRYFVASVVV